MSEDNKKADQTQPETVSKAEFDALRSKLDKEALRTVDLQKKLEAFGGMTPDDIASLRANHNALEEKVAKQGGEKDVEALIEKRFGEKLAGIESEWQADKEKLAGANKKLHELTVVDKVMGAIGSQFVQDPLVQDSIKRLVRTSCDIGEDGNIIVKDSEGNVMRAPGSATQPMTVEHWGSILAEKNPTLVANRTKGGSRSNGHAQYTGGERKLTAQEYLNMGEEGRKQLSPEQRMKLASQIK